MKLIALLALTACSSDPKSAVADAPDHAIDAMADGAPDAPATGTASIRIANLGTSNVGLPVSFADPTGAPTQLVMTDATGMASATVTAGGSVTVFVNTSLALAVLDVQPGDAIVVDNGPIPTVVGTANVNVTAKTNATNYAVTAGCNARNQAATTPPAAMSLDITTACVTGTNTYDLFATATDASDRLIAYQAQLDLVPPTGTKSIAMSSWQTAFTSLAVALGNAPVGSDVVEVDTFALRDKRRFRGDSVSGPIVAGGGSAQSLNLPAGAWSAMAYGVQVNNTSGGTTTVVRSAPTLGGLVTVDLSTDLLPYLHDQAVNFQNGTTPTIHFFADGPLTNARGMVAQVAYTASSGAIQMIVVMPAVVAAVDLPRLPDALSAYRPMLPFSGGVQVIEALGGDLFADAKAFREHFGRTLAGDLFPPSGGQTSLTVVQ